MSQSNLSYLDSFFGPAAVNYSGNTLPKEPTLQFAGAGVSVADDPVNKQTVVTIPGGISSNVVAINESGQELDITTQDQSTLLRATAYAGSSNGANIVLNKARGTKAAPTHALSGDSLGGLYARGRYDDAGGGFGTTANGLGFYALQDWLSTAQGAYFSLRLSASGAATANEVFRVNPDGTYYFYNPAGTFRYVLTASAIAASYAITLPLLTANDTFEMLAAAQSPTNKTIVAASNTITDTGAALGDLLYFNGTRFVRLPRGTAGQVLTATSATINWAAATGGGGTPGGSSTYVQFNGSGAFAGDAGMTYTVGSQLLEVVNLRVDGTFSSSKNNYTDNATLVSGCDLLKIEQALNADFSNATTTLASTNLSFSMEAGSSWKVELDVTVQGNAAGTGELLAIAVPSGASVFGLFISSAGALPSATPGLGQVLVVAPSTFLSIAASASQTEFVHVSFIVTNPSTAGSCTLQMKSGSASASLVKAGSSLSARRSLKV